MIPVFKRTICLIISILSIAIITGCQQEHVYLNGEKIDNYVMQQYIDTAKIYWEKVYELGDKPKIDTSNKDYKAINILFFTNYNEAKKYLEYDEKEWKEDYLKKIILKEELFDNVPIMREQIPSIFDQNVEQIKENGVIIYIDDSEIDLKQGLEVLSKKYNTSYEQYVDEVFREFCINLLAEESLLGYFVRNGYRGEEIDWNGVNSDEFTDFIKDLYIQYEVYKNNMLKKADIKYEKP